MYPNAQTHTQTRPRSPKNTHDPAAPPPPSTTHTNSYIEVDVDIDTNAAVTYIVHMVQGATRSMVIDHA